MISQDSYDKLIAMLKHQEGYRQFPYKDSEGVLTVGYGRNLEANGISELEASRLLDNDVMKANSHQWGLELGVKILQDEVRMCVIIMMAFNLGIQGVLGFKRMLDALNDWNYEQAAREMLDSKWAEQVGKEPGQRAYVLAEMMRMGEWV